MKSKINIFKIVTICIVTTIIISNIIVVIMAKQGMFLDNDRKLLSKDKKIYDVDQPSYIPKEFVYKEGTINTGYVVQDNNGNEFVWVPINENTIKFERTNFNIGEAFANCSEEENLDILNSVKTYKGFYIARYEAGKEENKLVSKKNVQVWNNVSKQDAKTLSNVMYNYEDSGVHSTLITSYAWDTTMIWLGDISNSINAKKSYIKDSTEMGNYTNGIMLTGKNKSYAVKNIYDLAGNVGEWTTEEIYSNGNNFSVARGGTYMYIPKFNIPASARLRVDSSDISEDIGFRFILYK